jgi:hypothetical protein
MPRPPLGRWKCILARRIVDLIIDTRDWKTTNNNRAAERAWAVTAARSGRV